MPRTRVARTLALEPHISDLLDLLAEKLGKPRYVVVSELLVEKARELGLLE